MRAPPSAAAGLPKPSRNRSSIAATRALTSGTGASTRDARRSRSHSTVSQTGLVAEPAASNNDAVSYSTFSAAATANDGLTIDGSGPAIAAATVASKGSGAASTIARNTGPVRTRFFGVRPCRIVSASTLANSLE